MAYCKNCGSEIHDEAVICPKCGVPQKNQQNIDDRGGFGWGLLGFCLPIVGLILYLVWRDTQPLNAKAAGMGAIISFILSIVGYIIYFIFIAAYLNAYTI